MLHYESLQKNEPVFLSIPRVAVMEFQVLLRAFEGAQAESFHLTAEGLPRQRKKGGGQVGKLPRAEDKLLFILSYIKNYPTQTYHGQQFGLSQSKTNLQLHAL